MAFYEVTDNEEFTCRACLIINPDVLYCFQDELNTEICLPKMFKFVTGIEVSCL